MSNNKIPSVSNPTQNYNKENRNKEKNNFPREKCKPIRNPGLKQKNIKLLCNFK